MGSKIIRRKQHKLKAYLKSTSILLNLESLKLQCTSSMCSHWCILGEEISQQRRKRKHNVSGINRISRQNASSNLLTTRPSGISAYPVHPNIGNGVSV